VTVSALTVHFFLTTYGVSPNLYNNNNNNIIIIIYLQNKSKITVVGFWAYENEILVIRKMVEKNKTEFVD